MVTGDDDNDVGEDGKLFFVVVGDNVVFVGIIGDMMVDGFVVVVVDITG